MRVELSSPRPRRRIVSLVPMVDVVMNLLFFFMLATAYTTLKPVALDLADAAGGDGKPASSAAPPRLRVDGDTVTLDGVRQSLDAALIQLERQHAGVVIVQPAPKLAVQPLLAVVDRLRAAGFRPSLARAASPSPP